MEVCEENQQGLSGQWVPTVTHALPHIREDCIKTCFTVQPRLLRRHLHDQETVLPVKTKYHRQKIHVEERNLKET